MGILMYFMPIMLRPLCGRRETFFTLSLRPVMVVPNLTVWAKASHQRHASSVLVGHVFTRLYSDHQEDSQNTVYMSSVQRQFLPFFDFCRKLATHLTNVIWVVCTVMKLRSCHYPTFAIITATTYTKMPLFNAHVKRN